jgi:hypothetical protein
MSHLRLHTAAALQVPDESPGPEYVPGARVFARQGGTACIADSGTTVAR